MLLNSLFLSPSFSFSIVSAECPLNTFSNANNSRDCLREWQRQRDEKSGREETEGEEAKQDRA
jgi:hypothetical protein